MSLKTRHYMSEQQGQGTSVRKVSLVISALPPLPVGILVKYLAGSKLLWVSCPEVSFPSLSTCFLSFKSLSTCLSCVCLPLGSALRAAVTEQLASEWGSPYSLESSAWASCITLITPVPRMDNTIHKEVGTILMSDPRCDSEVKAVWTPFTLELWLQ